MISTISKKYIRKVRESEQKKSVLSTDLITTHFKNNPNDTDYKKKIENADFKLQKVFPQFK